MFSFFLFFSLIAFSPPSSFFFFLSNVLSKVCQNLLVSSPLWRPGCPDRAGEADLQRHRRLHGPHRGLPAGETVRGQRGRQQVRCGRRADKLKTSAPARACFLKCTVARLLRVRRAIIIRNNEIIPVSTEFTPESERQRLQFLVNKDSA